MSKWLKLKKSNCKNCYKCVWYCPVKSIRVTGNQAQIVGEDCILCGRCFVNCPQNAKEITAETEKVNVLLQSGELVIVSLAPSFAAEYGVGIESMRKALKSLGFFDVEETAIGATIVKNEYNRMLREEKPDILISSCCHSINLLIQKYFPDCLPYLANTMSPMQAHCRDIKKRYPSAKTVFIGPCLSKKDEEDSIEGLVDAVLTFDELTEWLDARHIILEKGEMDHPEESRTRLFPTAGGILKSMREEVPGYTYIAIDGTKKCIRALRDIEEGKVHQCFIEMSSCSGGCISGPVIAKKNYSTIQEYKIIRDYAGREDFPVEQPSATEIARDFSPIVRSYAKPTEEEIRAVLKNMGRTRPEDELNCGSCGYGTCREKAIAVCLGKAEIAMCMPYLKDKAESFSDNIVNNTPNGIIVVNEQLEVQLINKSAKKILNVGSSRDVLGEPVVHILDPMPFLTAAETGRGITDKRVYLAEYEKYVEQTIVVDRDYHIVICMLRDVTEEEKNKAHREKISSQTIEVADRVVDNQMKIVQEIASLLGETAAETKIALTKLKEAIADE